MQAEGRNASGRTSASVRVEMHDSGCKITAASYFGVEETGRRPGKVPGNIIGILEAWIEAKGIEVRQVPYIRQPSDRWQPKFSVAERSRKLAAGAMAHAIKTSGTRLYQDGGEAVIYTPAIENLLNDLTRDIADILVKETLVLDK